MKSIKELAREQGTAENRENLTGYAKFEHIAGKVCSVLFHFRKVILAAPVVYYALVLFNYNRVHLPESVGLLLQADGSFAYHMSRELALFGPLGITAACLLLMCCSRKALYGWAISVFTLALPILLYISNVYPA